MKETNKYLISVIIPTFRDEGFIWECLDSICNQTIAKENYEIIVVLNGKNEEYHQSLKLYSNNINIKLLHTELLGVSNARNIGLDAAQGEYITFIDDDDYVSENYLQSLIDVASTDTIATSYTIGIDENGNALSTPYRIEKEYLNYAKHGKQPFYKPSRYMDGTWTKLIHRTIIGDLRFDKNFKNGEDSLFMFAISKNIQYINFTDKTAIYYRRFRRGSASQNYNICYNIKNSINLMKSYTVIYAKSSKRYNLFFYLTRLRGSINTIIMSIIKTISN